MIYLTWVFEFMAYSGAWKLEMFFSLFQSNENQQLQQHCFLPGGKIISGHMEGSHICSTHSPLVSHKAQCWWHLTHPCLSSFKHTCFCTALISACPADILLGGSSSAETNSHQVWVAVYFLEDASKTASPHQPLVISLDISQITPSDTACNLRVVLESRATNFLSWLKLLKWLSYRFPLHHQEDLRIWPFLSTEATQVLFQSLGIFRFDYISALAGLPLHAIRLLQLTQNSAAWCFQSPQVSPTPPRCCFPFTGFL